MIPCLYLIIPCYNEQDVLPVTAPVFRSKISSLVSAEKISAESRILFVNDGSTDATGEIINNLCEKDGCFMSVTLSRNFGHQNALLAGLNEAKDSCDITISIDCDGQDDINAVDSMLEEYGKGSQIVYGVRDDRSTDSFFKRSSAQCFYKFMRFMGAETVYNHADYRLVSSEVLSSFENFDEVNIYLRGMFPLVGFASSCVYYKRSERLAGKTHYSFGKMIALAFNGITGLSVKPLRLIMLAGLLISLISLVLIIYSLVRYFTGNVVPGWASTMVAVCFIGGVQMLCVGVLGEYIGKIYLEVKHRPKYIISSRSSDDKQEE